MISLCTESLDYQQHGISVNTLRSEKQGDKEKRNRRKRWRTKGKGKNVIGMEKRRKGKRREQKHDEEGERKMGQR